MTAYEREQTTEAWLLYGHQHSIHVQVQVGGTNLPDVVSLVGGPAAGGKEGNGEYVMFSLLKLMKCPMASGASRWPQWRGLDPVPAGTVQQARQRGRARAIFEPGSRRRPADAPPLLPQPWLHRSQP